MTGQAPEWSEWPTATDLAERWGCSPSTVLRYRREERLDGLQVFRIWRFRPESVAACEATLAKLNDPREGLER